MERWERRERKLKRQREGMQVTGIGLKKVLLPVLRKKAEEAERKKAEEAERPASKKRGQKAKRPAR